MGNTSAEEQKQRQMYKILIDVDTYFRTEQWKQFHQSTFNNYSVIFSNNPDRIRFSKKIQQILKVEEGEPQPKITARQLEIQGRLGRAIGCFIGLAVCDSLASPVQFMEFQKNRKDLIGHDFSTIKQQIKKKMIPLVQHKIGLWSDDTSMALCLADSLYLNNSQFVPRHFRYLLSIWKQHGLNNGGRKKTHGITQNVLTSIQQFCLKQTDYETSQRQHVGKNGNQGLSRVAPIVICFCDNQKQIPELAGLQCKVTNPGVEAVDCCKLLSLVLVKLINRDQNQNWKTTLNQACSLFANLPRVCSSVVALALSKRQNIDQFQNELHLFGPGFKLQNKTLDDRNWDWKSENFTYSKFRVHNQPKSIGSYCMDALAMALHIIWFSESFKQIAIKSANMGGNCCTVGAIAGQIGGAIYGLEDYMMSIYQQMEDVKAGRYEVLLKAYKLMVHPPV